MDFLIFKSKAMKHKKIILIFVLFATIVALGQDPAGSLDKQMTSATPRADTNGVLVNYFPFSIKKGGIIFVSFSEDLANKIFTWSAQDQASEKYFVFQGKETVGPAVDQVGHIFRTKDVGLILPFPGDIRGKLIFILILMVLIPSKRNFN